MRLRLPTLTMLAALVVLASAGGTAMVLAESDRARTRLLDEVKTRDDLRARQLAEAVGQNTATLVHLFDMALRELCEAFSAGEEPFGTVLDLLLKSFPPGSVDRILVLDAQGIVVFSSDPQGRGLDLSDRDYFRVHADGDEDRLFIGAPISGRIGAPNTVIPFSRTIRRNGRFVGVAAASLNPGFLSEALRVISLNPRDVVSILLSDGSYLARNHGLEQALGRKIPENRSFMGSGRENSGSYHAVSVIDGIALNYAWKRVEPWPLIAIVGIDEDAELAPIKAADDAGKQRITLILGALWAFSLGIVGLLLWAQRQQKQLADREGLVSSVMNSLRDSIVVLDSQGRVIRVNEAWRALARENDAPPSVVEGVGLDYFEACGTDPNAAGILDGMRAVLAGVQPRFDLEYSCLTPQGPRWFDCRVTRLEGGVAGLVASHGEVTERKLTEARLEREASRYLSILRTASDGIHIFDTTGTVIEASESFWQMLGYDGPPPTPLTMLDIEDSLTPDGLGAAIERLFAAPALSETRYLGRDGTLIEVEVGARGVEIDGARLIYASARDIRRRRFLEAALAERTANLQRHSENLRVLNDIAAVRADGTAAKLVAALEMGRQHLSLESGLVCRVEGGYATVEYRSAAQPTIGAKTGDIIPLAESLCSLCLESGDVLAVPDLSHSAWAGHPCRKRDLIGSYIGTPVGVRGAVYGTLSFFAPSPSPRAFDAGDTEFMRLLARWIGAVIEEDTTRQDLARSNAELEQFAYVASHDLRQPLRQIASYVSLLERRYGDQLGPDGRDFIAFAREGAVRMDALIVDLLEFSRVGRIGKVMEPVALGAVVERSLENLAELIVESGCRIEVAPDLPSVWGDGSDLVRLFQNLISNAITYRQPDRPAEVRIHATTRGQSHVVTVSDNGIGIEPAYFETIFRIFQRLHTPDRYEGTGIGLAICKKVVEQMNGRIRVESVPGQGSDFHIELPIRL